MNYEFGISGRVYTLRIITGEAGNKVLNAQRSGSYFVCFRRLFGLASSSQAPYLSRPRLQKSLRGLSIIPLLLLSPKSLADFPGTPECTVCVQKSAVFILTAVARTGHLSEK